MAKECPYLAGCPFYDFARLKGTQRALIAAFCKGMYTSCARYELRSAGKPVPKRLWPDGKLAKHDAGSSNSFAAL